LVATHAAMIPARVKANQSRCEGITCGKGLL
jgi:hypothetical protein